MKTSLKVMLGFAAGYAVGSIIMKLIDNRTMEQKIQDAVEEELAKLELNKKEIDECDEQNEITEEHSDEAVVENENKNENENENENEETAVVTEPVIESLKTVQQNLINAKKQEKQLASLIREYDEINKYAKLVEVVHQ